MTRDHYPSVTIVAGELEQVVAPAATFGHMVRMHGGATYIHITPETAKQWIGVLNTIAEEESK